MEHYFCVKKIGVHYVAFIQPTEPNDIEPPAENAIEIGRVLIVCMANPKDFRVWADMMGRTSDLVVRSFLEAQGQKITESTVEVTVDLIPKVN